MTSSSGGFESPTLSHILARLDKLMYTKRILLCQVTHLDVAQPEAGTRGISSKWMSSGLGDETCKGASNLNLQLPAVTDGGGGGGRLTKWGINFQLNFPLKVLEKREGWGQQLN